MQKEGKNNFVMYAAVMGIVIIVIVLVIGTFWTGRRAGEDTEEAVRNVSLFYLDELAGRREQVLNSRMKDYFNDMGIALGMMEKEDLESMEALQAYQAKMKQLYSLERFAFVDEDGLIYTSTGTRRDIDQYDFDHKTITGPHISVKYHEDGAKKVVFAMPVDRLPFDGKYLTVCFMEMDMSRLLEGIAMQQEGNTTTFCNMYSKEGLALTNIVLGGLSSEKNILGAMKRADFENGYSLDGLKKDFLEGREGFVSFTYNNIQETLYYVPVRGTDWMLTYLIRESMISNQISNISNGIIRRNTMQTVMTACMLLLMFLFMIVQMRKASRINLEKEVSEAENRVRQQELEEQLAMQEELLAQEKRRVQQDSMITALASDYRSVYYVNLDKDEGICYRNAHQQDNAIAEGEHFCFSSFFRNYAEKYVGEDYRKAFLDFIEPDTIRKKLQDGGIIACRYLLQKEGKESYEMLRMAGVRHAEDRSDHLIHAIGIGFTDIDAEMRDSMAKNQALNDALRASEEANKAKTVFLSNMSHEIRTPMNAIIGLDSLALHEKEISPKVKDYLEKIGSSAQHLLGLINDILDMSRIESGRISIRNEEFAFFKLIEQINTLFSGQCAEKGLEYNCRINGELDDYYIGDDTKIKQVLINILGNAVKFTPSGGSVDFVVEKTATYENRSTLCFIIRDDGIGMSSDFLPKLFDTFSQEDSMAANKYGSSGLGMAITKNIVEMMNGRIEVESKKGLGTTFQVYITLLHSERRSDNEGDVEIRPQEMSVLVIDDDPIACEHAKLVLEKVGIASEAALSGRDAVEMVRLRHARQDAYNLIIVDWKMPDMDGVETTRQIRSIIGNESAIIILTAYNWDDVLEEAIQAGVDSFISKPLFSGSLLDELKSALRRKNSSMAKAVKLADLNGRRILLAEDVEINAQIIMNILEMKGMVTEHAENGRIAVSMFASRPVGYYDAILMDMRMPEMNGLEATEAIRDMDRPDAKTMPIIALTANAFDEDVQRSLQAGLNAHLSKPVQPDVIFETLGKLIHD